MLQGEDITLPATNIYIACTNPAAVLCQYAESVSPSPGGEGRGEVERQIISPVQPAFSWVACIVGGLA